MPILRGIVTDLAAAKGINHGVVDTGARQRTTKSVTMAPGSRCRYGVAVSLGWIFRDAVRDVIDVLDRAGRWGLIALASALLLYVATKALQRSRLIRTLRMARLSVEALHEMIARDEHPLIVDVRPLTSVKQGRIPGAVWIDSDAFEESVKTGELLDRATDEVVYCACPNEASAAAVAKKLMRAGFKHVRPLAGGIEAWIEKSYRVETGA